MIDISIPFTIIQVCCFCHCGYSIYRLKRLHKKIGLRLAISILEPWMVVCYDYTRHMFNYFKNNRNVIAV